MQRSCIRIFRKQRSRSTPLDPKLTFWCVSYRLRAFGTVKLPYETRGKMFKLVQKFVPRCCFESFRNERTRSTPLDPKLMFCCVLLCLGAFGTNRYCIKLGANWAERVQSMQKFMPRSHIGMFRNERTRSTPLDPKLTFWCISYQLGAFGTI